MACEYGLLTEQQSNYGIRVWDTESTARMACEAVMVCEDGLLTEQQSNYGMRVWDTESTARMACEAIMACEYGLLTEQHSNNGMLCCVHQSGLLMNWAPCIHPL